MVDTSKLKHRCTISFGFGTHLKTCSGNQNLTYQFFVMAFTPTKSGNGIFSSKTKSLIEVPDIQIFHLRPLRTENELK